MKTVIHALSSLTFLSLTYVSHAAVSVGITGPVVGKDTIDLGSPEPIFNQVGGQITHPFHNSFVNIYGGLTGAESFDFDTGLDLALGHNAINNINYPSDLAAPTGEGYWSGLIDVNHGLSGILGVDEADKIGFAFRGFSLNTNVAADYFLNTTTNLETRIYRGGEVGIFDLGTNNLLYTQAGLTATVYIDWDGGDIGVTPFDTDAEIGDLDTTIEGWTSVIESYYSDGDTPIQVDGGSALGNYALFPGSGQVTVVPEASSLYGIASALIAALVYRRRTKL